jgi:hypothetical protein
MRSKLRLSIRFKSIIVFFSYLEHLIGMTHGAYDYGLEDKILRKNIPGRYGTWEDDDPHEKSRVSKDRSEDDGGDYSGDTKVADTQKDPAALVPAPRARSQKTGAKGVLRDHQEHLAHEREEHLREQAEREADYRRAAYGTTAPPVSASHSEFQHGLQDKGEDSDDDDDRAALALHRRRRVAELQAAAHAPVFGEVKEVSALEMLEAVENEVR